jgi:hypothetical protein
MLVHRDYVVSAEFLFCIYTGELTHLAAAVGAGKQIDRVLRRLVHITWLDQVPIHAVLNHFRNSADVCCDHGHFAGHGFQCRQAKRFQLRRQKKKISLAELGLDCVLFSQKQDIVLYVSGQGQLSRWAAVGTITDHDKLGWHPLAHQGKYFDSIKDSFNGPEIGEVHQDDFSVRSPLRA